MNEGRVTANASRVITNIANIVGPLKAAGLENGRLVTLLTMATQILIGRWKEYYTSLEDVFTDGTELYDYTMNWRNYKPREQASEQELNTFAQLQFVSHAMMAFAEGEDLDKVFDCDLEGHWYPKAKELWR